jgi:hypothetical protein
VEYALLLVAVLAGAALAILIGRTILACTIHLMHAGLPCTFHWRPVVFTAALFWFWYLAPAIGESRAATSVIKLVRLDASQTQSAQSPRPN